MSHDLIAVTGGSADGQNVAIGAGRTGRKSTKFDGQIVNLERKLIKSGVDVLETSFEDITTSIELAGSVLADGVGQTVVGGTFFAGSHIKITPVDAIRGGGKRLSPAVAGQAKGNNSKGEKK